jgi:acetyltransferase-like isoleucine patch superfamily enzyme
MAVSSDLENMGFGPGNRLGRARFLIQFWRYPSFFCDLVIVPMYLLSLQSRGLVVGPGCQFRGMPLISLQRGSSMRIGRQCRFVSRACETALGTNHPMILRNMRPNSRLTIGSGVRASGTTICCAHSVEIGDRVVIGSNTIIADTDFHSLDAAVRSSAGDFEDAAVKPVQIGSDVFLGAGVVILKGVTIGDRAIVGAGAVVTSEVLPGEIVAGNPARKIGKAE